MSITRYFSLLVMTMAGFKSGREAVIVTLNIRKNLEPGRLRVNSVTKHCKEIGAEVSMDVTQIKLIIFDVGQTLLFLTPSSEEVLLARCQQLAIDVECIFQGGLYNGRSGG